MTQQLLRLPAVKSLTGLSRSSIYLYIEKGVFPKPVKIGKRSVAWSANEINAVLSARISGKTETEIVALVSEAQEARRG